MQHYNYEEFFGDVKDIAYKVRDAYKPDVILAIARGGLTFGHFLAHALDNRMLYAMNSIHYEDTNKMDTIKIFNIPDLSDAKKVLIVDDIVDSGETIAEIKKILREKYPTTEFKTAALFYKEKAIVRPDFWAREAKGWIKFLWDFSI
ncbi:MAG: phosphoribosyltransferase [Campylobacteraceae bacterium]|jgi:xanthine phosphoribosyltransferase|nr:phosphoribosyltransferase [Campylobacteraceae bacterium]